MREVVFVSRNSERWKSFEQSLANTRETHPDELAKLFIQITDDLAYARTFYPKSRATQYLNTIALKAHQQIYINRKEKTSRIRTFWTTEFPLLMHRNRKFVLYAFLFFMLAVSIGAISAANDDRFVRLILSDRYVNMTIENIKKGDPMAVYASSDQWDMFYGITLNNIRVMFYTFVTGTVVSFGTLAVLFSNGIMLGSFQYFFYEYNVLYESVLSIWIHGTFEIFCIIMGGAAGLTIGNSILFPGTFSRINSFKRGAKDGLKMVFAMLPFIITAGFLESFVTRHTHWPDFIRIGIILGSLAIIVWYFFIYPNLLARKMQREIDKHTNN